MRLSPNHIATIRSLVAQLAGDSAQVWLFGSRVDDAARGGDVDLLLDMAEPVAQPALLAAQLGARVSRAMQGRKVDVLIKAPNLQLLAVHRVALVQGVLL